jgi:plasmid stability protein
MPIEKRTKMVGCHMTEREKQFLRVHAAKQGDTISDFIRKTLTDVLSKVEDQNNPFTEIKINQ